MNSTDTAAALEALIFASGDSVETLRLCEATGLSEEEVLSSLETLRARLEKKESGITLFRLGTRWQLASKKEYASEVRAMLDKKRNTPLSQAAFEVLAVVAYNQPVTKSYIEQVRGVDCSGVIQALTQKELIEECGRMDLPGRPILYGTTDNFLRCFGLSDISELPPLPQAQEEQQTENAGNGEERE